MFDFSRYNLGELNAIYEMLDYIDHGGSISYQMSACNDEIAERMDQMAHSEQAQAGADDPAPPDMFGWVGDALDDLCAAGEVMGS